MEDWPEIAHCKEKNRRELTIKDCPDRFERVGFALPKQLYGLTQVNLLEISGCSIENVSEDIGSLVSLANLVLSGNKLQQLPESLCKLVNLKVLDLSNNEITEIPSDVGLLASLQTINLNSNRLSCLPESCGKLSLLSTLDISNNEFKHLPDILLSGKHPHLAELKASHNQIEDISDGVGELEGLKSLNLSSNKIQELPQVLSNCLKLKNADYGDNPLKDRRLKKLIEQKNSSQKAIMDYIRTKGRPPKASEGNSGKTVPTGKKKKKGGQVPEVNEDLICYILKVLRFDGGKVREQPKNHLEIVVSDEVREIRPYIVCCIVKRLDLSSELMLKKFLAVQTKLHEGACAKRTIATIASHDLSSLQDSTLTYDAKEPDQFSIKPLGRMEEVTALELFHQLKVEAEEMRKEKKKSQISGIYKYLSLLEKLEKFAYLSRSSDGAVISLPPLTNSDVSRIKIGENDVLLEVTGTQNLSSCKNIMDKLLHSMVNEGLHSGRERDFYSDSSDGDEAPVERKGPASLVIQQVKILDSTGKLKVIYPSRTDLSFTDPAIKVERPN